MAMGRPSKLTPELTEQVKQLLLAGNFVETVCDYVGINKSTFYDWLRRGERGWKTDIDGGYVDFSNAIKKAIAQVEIITIADLRNGPQGWQAKAWWLERRYPDRWGNRQKHTVAGSRDEPVQVKNEHSGKVGVKHSVSEDDAAGILDVLNSIGAFEALEDVGGDEEQD